ncbi:tetratricopeptide repeat protein [Owenweeksia hongkongensis]|uniref:tetratricopeptide repeat protein n=1 Tax=Owenweeksia hongkongensis TaxID=253245 RepID=UPI003A932B41
MYFKLNHLTVFIFLFSGISTAFAQADDILAKATACYAEKQSDCKSVLNEAMRSAKSEMSDSAYLSWIGKNAQNLANKGMFVPAKILAHQRYREFQKGQDSAKIGKALLRLGAYHLYSGELDSSLFYHQKSLEWYTLLQDSIRIGFGYINVGLSYKELGKYPEAFDSYTKALKLYQTLGEEGYEARVYSELASLSAMTGEVEKAINFNRKAADFYKDNEDQHTYAYILTNLANDLIYTLREDTAEALLKTAISIFDEEKDNNLLMNAEAQLGRVKYHQGQYDSAITLFERSNSRAMEGSFLAQQAYNAEFLSTCYSELKNYKKAIEYARKSYEYNQQIGYNEEYGHSLMALYEVYKRDEQPDSAIKYLELYHAVKDSLFGMESANQLNELKVKYETELKEERLNAQQADIDLLRTKSANQRIRTIALGAGIFLILIIAIMMLKSQNAKMEHQRSIAEKKEELYRVEVERQEAQQEQLLIKLENKKRELTNQALLIAEKNEMLRSFKEQLEDISEKVEENTAMNGLVRKIERAETKVEDWDKFMHIFEDVHPDFVKLMKTKFEKITANDLRLAALLRMNFSSKEMANILHISADGLKKARYRLRKKLELSSDENLQEYIVKL